MGTRSTVKFYDGDKNFIGGVYQQYDGYPSCVGLELAKFIKSKTLVNGFSGDIKDLANGLGCLGAQYIAKIKVGVGGVYLTNQEDTQEYDYVVNYDNDFNVTIEVDNFKGNVDEFIEYCQSDDVE